MSGECGARRRSEGCRGHSFRLAERGDCTACEPELLREPLVAQGIDQGDDPLAAGPGAPEGRQGERRQIRDRRDGHGERGAEPQGGREGDADAGEAPGSAERQDAVEVGKGDPGAEQARIDVVEEGRSGATLAAARGEQRAVARHRRAGDRRAGIEGEPGGHRSPV
ncbi:MAG: hypothetical protein QG573_1689 [Acidobacteriota bacterium]|nr:hypothetical protein [Acidobacteriota bacterium]